MRCFIKVTINKQGHQVNLEEFAFEKTLFTARIVSKRLNQEQIKVSYEK